MIPGLKSTAAERTRAVAAPSPGSGKVIDFRTGNNVWGHALHGSTWRGIAPRVTGHLWWKRSVERVSVMCHSQTWPEPGDTLLFTAKGNHERRALIAEVEPCWDPRDMFTLILEPLPDQREAVVPHAAQTPAKPSGCASK